MENKLLSALAFLTTVFLINSVAEASENCQSFKNLIPISRDSLDFEKLDPFLRIQFLEKNEILNRKKAKDLAEVYLAGQLTKDFFKHCLPFEKDNPIFFDSLSKEMQALGVQKLLSSKIVELNRLGHILINKSEGDFLFRAVGHRRDENERKAEFHRSNRSIYTDLSKINSEEWLIIFIHEVIHYLDHSLESSVKVFGNKENIDWINAIIENKVGFTRLSASDQSRVKHFVLAGIDRGFLAEFRAWAMTFWLYEKMVASSEQVKLKWAEDILAEKNQDELMADFIFRYLEPNFTDPKKEHIFKSDIIWEAYFSVRSELRNMNKYKLLGRTGLRLN